MIKLNNGETIVLERLVNLFRGLEAVGGKLYITNERLFFQPHSLNIQAEPQSILIQEITNIKKRNNLLFVPNGLLVETPQKDYKFVLWGRSKVIEAVENIQKHK